MTKKFVGMWMLVAMGSMACKKNADVVAKVGEKSITMEELDKKSSKKLYEVRALYLEEMIAEMLVKEAAQKAGMDEQAYLRSEVEKRISKVSETEAEDYFNKNKERLFAEEGLAPLKDKPFADWKDFLIQGLTVEKRQAAIPELIAELRKKAGVKILLKPTRVQVAADGPTKGPASAKVTIVEFSDFQCPFCGKGRELMEKAIAKHGNKVRVVFRDFPLSSHTMAQKAAEAGHCAYEQGKFWEMHDWMFANQTNLSPEELKKAARNDVKVKNPDQFDACLQSGKYAAVVGKNAQDGASVGVKGTPAFFVNGIFVSGINESALTSAIEGELAE